MRAAPCVLAKAAALALASASVTVFAADVPGPSCSGFGYRVVRGRVGDALDRTIANQLARTAKVQLPKVMDAPSPTIVEDAVEICFLLLHTDSIAPIASLILLSSTPSRRVVFPAFRNPPVVASLVALSPICISFESSLEESSS